VVFRVPEERFQEAPDAPAFSRLARKHDLLVNPMDRRRMRAVTHLDVSREEIPEVLERMRGFLR